jgi:hypothetical protein
MFERLKLIYRLSLDFSRGDIRLGDTRVFIGPTKILAHTRTKLRDIGPTGDRFLYEAGKEAGEDYAESVWEVTGDLETEQDFIEMCAEFGGYTGWGHIEVIESDMENSEFRLSIENGMIESGAEERTPYTSGMFAGAAVVILDRDMDVQKDLEASTDEKEIYEMKPAEDFQVSWSS